MSTVLFNHINNCVYIDKLDENNQKAEVDPAVYTVQYNRDAGAFFLAKVMDKFPVPEKVYGGAPDRARKVLKAYKAYPRALGVLLTGLKGTGKTLLAQMLGNTMIESGRPVVMVESPFTGSQFNDFINTIGECCLMIDEIVKLYGKDKGYDAEQNKQGELLSLLDGAGRVKRLTVLMENEAYGISKYMKERPGRILYHFEYSNLGEDVTRGFLEDKGADEDIIKRFCKLTSNMTRYSFDILQALWFEYETFGVEKRLSEMLECLNVGNVKDTEYQLQITKLEEFDTKAPIKVNKRDRTMKLRAGGSHYVILAEEKDEEGDNIIWNFEWRDVKYQDEEIIMWEDEYYRMVCKKTEVGMFLFLDTCSHLSWSIDQL